MARLYRTNSAIWRFAASIILVWASGAVSLAAPVLYEISFTPDNGPAPTSGSFTYDADTTQFSEFLVVTRGISFDFTPFVNSGGFSGFSLFGCPTPDTSAGVAEWLLSTGCDKQYSVQQSFGALMTVILYEGGSVGGDTLVAVSSASPGLPVLDGGRFSVAAAVPEPTTAITLAIGTAALAALRKRRSSSSQTIQTHPGRHDS